MDINSIFKNGNKVNVLIRNKYAQQIGSYTLADNEPYTYITDVSIFFNYNQEDVSITQKGHVLSSAQDYPDSITIYNVPFTDKVSSLALIKNAAPVYKTNIMTVTAANNTIYLQNSECYNVYLYNNDNQLLGYFEQTDNYITGEELIDGEQYKVFYNYLVPSDDSISYELASPHFAYFTLEIFGEGNINDTTSALYLKLNKCSLSTSKDFVFNNQTGSNTINLTFNIIKGNKDILILE